VIECENRLRRDWQNFADVWVRTAELWRDQRRRQFEQEFLAELPAVLSRCQATVSEFEEVLRRTRQSLADPEKHA
jgi:hypothetical protein